MNITVDDHSGFCFGVVNAIKKAEEELAKGNSLYCLGDIVHNTREVVRLSEQGLITIDETQYKALHNATVLLRAHGAPPNIYEIAKENNITLIDATCPVVLRLQKRIKKAYQESKANTKKEQIVIYGKKGHAEVLGLMGQTMEEGIVIEKLEDVKNIDLNQSIILYSQTTKSHEEYLRIIDYIKENIKAGLSFNYYDTICTQVRNRMPLIKEFGANHDLIFFVSGKKSSNGKMLYKGCKEVNKNTFFIDSCADIDLNILKNFSVIGICGATSTPMWQMQEIANYIEEKFPNNQIQIIK